MRTRVCVCACVRTFVCEYSTSKFNLVLFGGPITTPSVAVLPVSNHLLRYTFFFFFFSKYAVCFLGVPSRPSAVQCSAKITVCFA